LDIVIFHLDMPSCEKHETAEHPHDALSLSAVRWQAGQVCGVFHHTSDGAGQTEAESLEDTLVKFLQFVEGAVLASLFVSEQMARLENLCEAHGYVVPTAAPALDLSVLCNILFPTEDCDFATLLKTNQIDLPDFHCPPEFVDRQAQLLSRCLDKALALPYVTLQQLAALASSHTSSLGAWFQWTADLRYQEQGTRLPDHCEQIHQLAFRKPDEETERKRPFENGQGNREEMDIVAYSKALLTDQSPLRNVLSGFQVRPGQMEMVQAVAEALEGDVHLLAEAGTGTGKSLAYLIPAVLYAIANDTRVVVSTHTISLQDQIAKRDFPLLRQVIPHELSLTVFKGRTHYVCMRKLLQEVRSVGIGSTQAELEAYMKLLVWLTETAEGNREELSMAGKLADVWPRIQSETETCINKRCPFFKPCYYFRARNRAFEADVVVTNHSLVFSDLKANHRVLPRYDKLVLDEAHHLEEEATKHLGDEVHLAQCLSLIGRLSRDHGKHGVVPELLARLQGTETRAARAVPTLEQMEETLSDLRQEVEAAFALMADWVPAGESDFRITSAVESKATWREYLDVVDKLHARLQELESQGATLSEIAESEPDEDLSGRLYDAAGFVAELSGKIQLLISVPTLNGDWVAWIEVASLGERRNVSLHFAPVDIANILRTSLFEAKSSVILTSATLSTGGSFDYAKWRLGLADADRDGRLQTVSVASPFRYHEQALLCVPTDVPELARMNTTEAAVWLTESLLQYAKISHGRLLALFTSHAMLRATAELLRDPLKAHGLELFAQGVDGSRSYLLEAFRAKPESVLLGAQSFWEGIDLPGDQLRVLVIVRLPFAPPNHPVTQARHERLEAEGLNPFAHDSLPQAIVRFRQGFGRLIRTVHDRGAVVVLDKRIVTTRYGSQFIKSVPGVKKCIGPERQVLAQIQAFLQPKS
jgi:ATP-dependent DNA helicase DinG